MQNTSNNKTYLRLTELTYNKAKEEFEEVGILVNTDFIAVVSSSKVEKSGPVIIGSNTVTDATLIQLHNGRSVFVKETVEVIGAMLMPALEND